MLNSELVRERVEHQTLMKELSKMDDVVLGQLSSGAGSFSRTGAGSFSQTGSRSFSIGKL